MPRPADTHADTYVEIRVHATNNVWIQRRGSEISFFYYGAGALPRALYDRHALAEALAAGGAAEEAEGRARGLRINKKEALARLQRGAAQRPTDVGALGVGAAGRGRRAARCAGRGAT